ncbi:hypothetical protein L484_001914 [Morus notabilis]|uniref:Uncharacterized protein n=1 Tax=Morus notabilis TaxID=981085 RepID=W9SFA7_9ROSA|nr:hypothetical protein L484_001914 [Morus notabilis]
MAVVKREKRAQGVGTSIVKKREEGARALLEAHCLEIGGVLPGFGGALSGFGGSQYEIKMLIMEDLRLRV